MPSTEPEVNDPFRIYLNSSDIDGQNNLNVTSTLVGPVSGFQSGDRIACPDNAGDPFILNFTSEFSLTFGFIMKWRPLQEVQWYNYYIHMYKPEVPLSNLCYTYRYRGLMLWPCINSTNLLFLLGVQHLSNPDHNHCCIPLSYLPNILRQININDCLLKLAYSHSLCSYYTSPWWFSSIS